MQNQNQNHESDDPRHNESKKMNPRVSKKADLFFNFFKKPKSNSYSNIDQSQSNSNHIKPSISEGPARIVHEQNNMGKEKARSSHSKKNPIAPIKQSIKMLDQFGKNINEDYSSFVSFTKSLSENRQREAKDEIKLEQCLTLKVLKKLENGGCVKKVLHVPTFKIYLLEERPISHTDSKQSIQKDLEKWNSCPPNTYQLKNIKIYWYTPSEFVTLLHEYVPHYSLESVLACANNLPEQALAEKMVEIIHMVNLFEKEGIKFPRLSSEEILVSFSGGIRVKPSISVGVEQSKLQNSMTYQIAKWIEPDNDKIKMPLGLGLLVLYLSLGNFIMQEEVGEKLFSLYDGERTKNQNKVGCCLLHRLDDFKDQLVLYSLSRQTWSHNLQDFLCKCLSFDRRKRADLDQIKKHSFITRVDEIQKVSFMDILRMARLENQPPNTTEIEIGFRLQLNKVSDAIRMILSNSPIKHRVQLPIKATNHTLQFIQEDIGLEKGMLMEKFNKVYAEFR